MLRKLVSRPLPNFYAMPLAVIDILAEFTTPAFLGLLALCSVLETHTYAN